MSAFASQLETFVTSARPVVIAIVAVALLINGVMFIYPSERSKEAEKTSMPWVVIGSAVALGAVALSKSITAGF